MCIIEFIVVKETHKNIKAKERRNDLKNRIRNVGISRLPTYKQLGEIHGVHVTQIWKDIQIIISEISPRDLDEMFTDFYQTDLRALDILKLIMVNGNNADKIKAINALMSLQKGATELLEAFGKKQKVADRLAVLTKNVDSAESLSKIYELVSLENNKPKDKIKIITSTDEKKNELN